MKRKTKGLILLVHGSKRVEWMKPFHALRNKVAMRTRGVDVVLAALEGGGPTVEQAVKRMVTRGVTRIIVAPVFLSSRGHVLRDVPGAVKKAAGMFPGADIRLTRAVGEDPAVVRAMVITLASKGLGRMVKAAYRRR